MAGNQAGAGGQDSDIARRRRNRREAGNSRSDERWTQILRGSTQVFRRLGYQQATLSDVAEEVGVDRSSLYYYVGTKEDLLVALLDPPIAQMTVRIEQIRRSDAPSTEKLRQVLMAYVRDMQDLPELFIFLSENVHQFMEGEEADRITLNADTYGRHFTAIVADGVESGVFRAGLDPTVVTLGIVGMFNWIHRWYVPSGPMDLDSIGRQFVDLALKGLGAPD